MAVHDINPALREYLGQLEASVAESTPSVFWQRQLDRKAVFGFGANSDTDLVAKRVVKAYGFDELPEGVAHPQDDPQYRLAMRGLKRGRAIAKQLDPSRLEIDKTTWEHVRALGFLDVHELLDEYLAFIGPLRIRSTMEAARHWYYARQLANLTSRTHPGQAQLDILEIGAGAGNLSIFLAEMGLVRSYTIVDLPKMLVHAAFTTQHFLPDVELRFECEPVPGAWTFVSDGMSDGVLGHGTFDLCVNFNSFMEMDRAARDGYFKLIYRTARPGALFFNVNRRQAALPLPDGTTWDNNPMLFPYRADEEILVWEEDPFQTVTRTKWALLTTLAVTRAAIVGSTGATPG